jgi:general stress protein YciG
MTAIATDEPKKNRGFASMTPDRQREIASNGGKAAHAGGRAHRFTIEEARCAGRKAGELISRDRAHMAAIGPASGEARRRSCATQGGGTELIEAANRRSERDPIPRTARAAPSDRQPPSPFPAAETSGAA